MSRKFSYAWLALPSIFLVWMIVAWLLAGPGQFDSYIFPQPWNLLIEAYYQIFPLVDPDADDDVRAFSMTNDLFVNVALSFSREVIGFTWALVVALVVGAFCGFSVAFRQYMSPIIAIFQAIPPIAWAPIMLMVFGIGWMSVLSVIFVAAVFPMILTIQEGILQIQGSEVRAAKVLGARGWQLYRYVYFPASLPYITTGMRLGFAYAWRSLVAAEMLGSQFGVGAMIQEGGEVGNMALSLLGIVIIGLVSYIFERFLFQKIEARYAQWSHTVV